MYDRIVSGNLRGRTVEYGIIEGSDTVFFIKVGQDGNIYGYMDKYMHLAELVHDRLGFTCITSSNPYDGDDPLGHAFEMMDEMFEDYSVYFMGHSNGARAGAIFGYRYHRIKAMLLSDSPLEDSDIDRINDGLSRFGGRVIMVYVDRDESFERIHMIDESIRIEVIQGEDHNYTKSMDDLYSLPFRFLFDGEFYG